MAEEEIEYTEVEVKSKESLKDALLNSDSPIARGAGFLDKNKKRLSIIGGGLVLITLGLFFYNQFIYKPADLKSQESLWHGEYALLNEQNWSAAISGDSIGNAGLKSVAESYSGYSGGDIAQYELGIAYLNNGQYQEAITALEQVAFEDEMIASITFGAIGDAYIELGNITSAAGYYEKAYTNSKNDLTGPIYMLKAAYAKETENKYEDAVKIYQKLMDEYQLAPEVNKAKKY
ncbi:MAG: tetratricopeptide repeat protein, partial [Flavobacteriales bacterium]|nr:tetratricopeptide repeat protein [Flavobacteriales bacterium]